MGVDGVGDCPSDRACGLSQSSFLRSLRPFAAALTATSGFMAVAADGSKHEAHVGRGEASEIWEDHAEIALRNAEPFCERRAVLDRKSVV